MYAAKHEEDDVQLVRGEENCVVASAEPLEGGHPEKKPATPRYHTREIVDVRAFAAVQPIRHLVCEDSPPARKPVPHVADCMKCIQGHHEMAQRAVKCNRLLIGATHGAPG